MGLGLGSVMVMVVGLGTLMVVELGLGSVMGLRLGLGSPSPSLLSFVEPLTSRQLGELTSRLHPTLL